MSAREGPRHVDLRDTSSVRAALVAAIVALSARSAIDAGVARVLRIFLGVTFVYAGVQKLADPGFLHAGSPDFIGSQVRGFAQGSPIAWLLDPLARVPVMTGIGIAVAELAIGIGTLAAIAPRVMALGGLLVSLALLLSATWHVHPYFLGSDSAYAVACLAYVIGYSEHQRRTGLPVEWGTPRARHAAARAVGRREVLRGGMVAGVTFATGALAKMLSGGRAAATVTAPGTATATPTPGTSERPSPAAAPSISGTPVARLASVPIGGAIAFQAPNGAPAALVRLSQNAVVAYSRVCTHAGCLVGYDAARRILVCPCHGAEFDPARRAVVIGGPAPGHCPRSPSGWTPPARS
jgi:thiosulfate dehydrogenase [quinone] large subunit